MNAQVFSLDAHRQLKAALKDAETKTKTELIDEFLLSLVAQEELDRALRTHHERIKRDLGDGAA